MIGQNVSPRTGVATLLHIENLDAKPEVSSVFPGKPKEAPAPPPKESTFRVDLNLEGYVASESITADRVWISGDAIWFAVGDELSAAFNMKHVISAVDVTNKPRVA